MSSFTKALLALGLLSCASLAQAAPITLYAEHFSVSYDDAGLYGQGFLSGSGDTIFFTPTQFKVSSGSGPVSVSSTLALTFIIDPGYAFTGLSYLEGGDYFLMGGATVDAASSIKAENTATLVASSLSLSPGAALDNVTSFASFHTTDWLLAGDLSLVGLGAPNTLQITLGNELIADTPATGFGFIEKKYLGLSVITEAALPPEAVPEPASWTLLLAGMMAALFIGSRRRARGTRQVDVC